MRGTTERYTSVCNGVHGWVCIPRGARLGVYTTGCTGGVYTTGCTGGVYTTWVQEEYLPRGAGRVPTTGGGRLPTTGGGRLPTHHGVPRLPTHHGVYTHLHTLGIPPSCGDMLYTRRLGCTVSAQRPLGSRRRLITKRGLYAPLGLSKV